MRAPKPRSLSAARERAQPARPVAPPAAAPLSAAPPSAAPHATVRFELGDGARVGQRESSEEGSRPRPAAQSSSSAHAQAQAQAQAQALFRPLPLSQAPTAAASPLSSRRGLKDGLKDRGLSASARRPGTASAKKKSLGGALEGDAAADERPPSRCALSMSMPPRKSS